MAKRREQGRSEGVTREATPEEVRAMNESQAAGQPEILAAEITEYPDGSRGETVYLDRPWPTPKSLRALRQLLFPEGTKDG